MAEAHEDMTQLTGPGERFVQELLWIHGILRDDLAIVRRLAEEVLNGEDPERVRIEISRLQTQSPLWQFKANCLYYCRLKRCA